MNSIEIKQLNPTQKLSSLEQQHINGGGTPQDTYWTNVANGQETKVNGGGKFYSTGRSAIIPTDGERTFFTDGNGYVESTINGESEEVLDIRGALIL